MPLIRRSSSAPLWMEHWSKTSSLGNTLRFPIVRFLQNYSWQLETKCTCICQYTAEVMSDPSISWLSTVASERKRTIIQTIPASHLQSVQIHQLRCGFITLIIELTEIKVESLNALWRVGPVCSQQAMIRIHSFSFLFSVFSLFSRLQLINPG